MWISKLRVSVFAAITVLLPLRGECADLGQLETPVTVELLDSSTFAESVGGVEKPIVNDNGDPVLPKLVVLTKTTIPFYNGTTFGKSKTPGPRHLRVGFLEPVAVGTVVAQGNVAVSFLKPGAAYPGNLENEEEWIPAQRIEGRATTSMEPMGKKKYGACMTWIVPPGTETRALRFTHVAEQSDLKYDGELFGAYVLSDRFVNIAPQATVIGSASRFVELVNNEAHDGWTAWDNGAEGGPQTIDKAPEWLIAHWPEPVSIQGMALLWTGFGAAQVEAFNGPENLHPRNASEKDWKPLGDLGELKSFFPSSMGLNRHSFENTVTTRALRLRITDALKNPKERESRGKEGRRIWLGEWLVLASLGEKPLETALLNAREPKESYEGMIPVRFSMPEKGFATLVIEDAEGNRVRNLISETPFEAGEQTVWWDGMDDLGRDKEAASRHIYQIPARPVAPGEYRVRGLWRKAITPRYDFSTYSPGNPPWSVQDHTGAWVANHTPPEAALFVPGERSLTGEPSVYIACFVTEGPDAIAWIDLDGNKRGGKGTIGGHWTGASHLACDLGSKADPEVSAYTGAGWRNDKEADSSLLRLNAITAKGDRKVMDVDLGMRPAGSLMSPALTGLAVRDGILVASLGIRNELLFLDTVAKQEIRRLPLENPRGLAFDSKGRLLVLAGERLLRYPSVEQVEGKPEVVITSHLEAPRSVTLDTQGNFYVSDWGKSHQVKVFSPEGKFLRAIGVAGTPKAGPYDPLHMNHPAGIAIDSRNQLWVAERDDLPRRVSIWSLDGKLIKAVYGPAKYGGGGTIDPKEKDRFYYSHERSGSMEFRLDWEKGTAELASVLYRSKGDGLMQNDLVSAPETPFYYKGRRYFSGCYNSAPVYGSLVGTLFQERDGIAYPVVAMGAAQRYKILKGEAFRGRWPEGIDPHAKRPVQAFFFWTDVNGDAEMNPEEVTIIPGENLGITVMPDLAFCVSYLDGKAVRFAPIGFSESGVPQYDITKGEVLLSDVKRATSSGGGQLLVDDEGWSVLTLGFGNFAAESISGAAQGGKNRWSYPSLWPGLHAGHHAPEPDRPGQLLATTRLLGGFVPCGKERLWAVNSDKGSPYLFTHDGLFVATLFKDYRQGSGWRMPVAQRGMSLEGVSLGGENFWPTIGTTPDGKVCLVDGSRSAIVRLDGVETIRRLPQSLLKVTPEMLALASERVARDEMIRQKEQGLGEGKVVLRTTAPTLDGNLEEWGESGWIDIDRRGGPRVLNAEIAKKRVFNIQGSVVVSQGHLYAAWKTGDPKLLSNTGEIETALFKTGGALDLMIGTDPHAKPDRKEAVAGDLRLLVTIVDKKVKALLYRAVVPGTKSEEKVPFTSPLRTITFDRVTDISDKVQFAADKTGNYEIAVPLDLLGLDPKPGMKLKADIGVLRGSGGETLSRTYWGNKATAIISDVPSEAELTPRLWGTWEFVQE